MLHLFKISLLLSERNHLLGQLHEENLQLHQRDSNVRSQQPRKYLFMLFQTGFTSTGPMNRAKRRRERCENVWKVWQTLHISIFKVYEVLNIRSLKQATPNLRVINLWGVRYLIKVVWSLNRLLNLQLCGRRPCRGVQFKLHPVGRYVGQFLPQSSGKLYQDSPSKVLLKQQGKHTTGLLMLMQLCIYQTHYFF